LDGAPRSSWGNHTIFQLLLESSIKTLIKKLLYCHIPSTRYFINSSFLYRSQLNKINQVCKTEKTNLTRAIESKIPIYIYYDRDVSPPTYGDFIYYAFLYRFIGLQDANCTFVIIDSRTNPEWDENKPFINELKKHQDLIIDLLSDSDKTRVIQLKERKNKVFIKEKNSYSLFQSQFDDFEGLHIYMFNFFNHIDISNNDKFLLSKNDIINKVDLNYSLINNGIPYISFQYRFNIEYGDDRNLSEKEFLRIYNKLKNSFPQMSIMIVSDKHGCDNARLWGKKNKLNLLYSKDYSSNFLEDIALIANSDFYFQFKGGGIGLFVAAISDLNQVQTWIFYGKNEIPVTKNKVFNWLKNNQIVMSNKSLAYTLKKIKEVENNE